MKKNILIPTFLLVAGVVAFFIFNSVKMETTVQEFENSRVDIEGKTDGFNSLEELENGSPIIIKGIKVEENGVEIFKSKIDGEIAGGYTKSNFKVTKVFKNSVDNQNIKVNGDIMILESNFYDAETKTTYSVNGYENMINGKEYLLFLTNETDGLFATRGVTFGKVPLGTDKLEIYKNRDSISSHSHDTSVLDTIFKEARKNYDK